MWPLTSQCLTAENIKTQKFKNTLNSWSDSHLMELNKLKKKIMLVNFTKKYQFATSLKLKGSKIEQVKKAKVLRTIISD